ncbi:phage terminase large subunit [Methylobacterium ajmalii]|uniref:phage terminase large subunit n=1 Tax=Methylobacterium ajmalii TaxID=2738439 RepID=UPI002F3557AB
MHNEFNVAPTDAATELLRRKRGRDSLIGFTEYTLAKYRADPFHHLVASKLEAVERGEIKRLMLFAPPRHGKSELSTRRFPAWYMARNPTHNIISASYNASFAKGFGRNVRDIISDVPFSRLFPDVNVRSDLRAADEWELEQGGQYYSVGVGSGTTGKGAHLFLIDDPIKDRKEADSATFREDQWDWYRDVVYTRLEESAPIILTLTRWHYDDIAGRLIELMNEGNGMPWEIVKLPALPEPERDPVTKVQIILPDGTIPADPLKRKLNEPLAPNRFSYESLVDRQQVLGDRSWSALYQQRPMSEEGGLFQASWFTFTVAPPLRRNRVRAWDLGATLDGDWTVSVLMSRDLQGGFYIEEVTRDRLTPAKVEDLIMRKAAQDGRGVQIILPQDPGQAGVSQIQNLTRKLAGYRVKAVRPSGSKEVRAAAFAAQCENKNVQLVGGAATGWRQVLLDELATFPLGTHDDQVDACADAFNALIGPRKAAARDW